MQNSYLAVTVGPIYKTFAQAKKTRAVWASSYLFSWLIKQIVSKAKNDFDLRLPYFAGDVPGKYGSGLYADRAYFIGDEINNQGRLQRIIDATIEELAGDVGNDCLPFLKSYFNIHLVEIPFKTGDKGEEYPLDEINKLLDHKELKQNYAFDIERNPLFEYLTKKINDDTILKKDAFGKNHERKFKSLPEIASASLQRQFPKEYNAALIKDLKNEDIELFDDEKLKSELKPFHKYYAVLYADGDNISKVLKNVQKNETDLKEFSKQLFEFGLNAEQRIAEYGGNGIYLGGEDILAFIPIACVKEKDDNSIETIFDLIKKIDEDFKNTLGSFADSKQLSITTLSYGIMMAYIKHPLKEAMSKAHDLLEVAKKLGNKKNKIGLCFQKHSGQRMECFIDKNHHSSYSNIQDLIKHYVANANENDELISGVMHRLNDDLFFDLYSTAVTENRIDAFYDNFFNEDIHKARVDFLNALKGFSVNTFKDYNDAKAVRSIIFTTLRYIHFINSNKE